MIRAAIAGAGNVANHIAKTLYAAGTEITEIYSRSRVTAAALAAQTDARVCSDLGALGADAHYVIIAVSDTAVESLSQMLPVTDATVVHTSGSIPLEKLSHRHSHAGVLYPLQTFSRDVPVDMSRVTFFTEATDAVTLESVDRLARMMSAHVYHANSAQRKYLHVAGVLSSNFTVYLLGQCESVLRKAGFPAEVVRPLAEATLAKVFDVGPHDAMTGPARRGDMAVVEAQARLLPPATAQIYRLISKQIYDEYHHEHD